MDKRRKKKQKDQAEDEAFLENDQEDAEYEQGKSGESHMRIYASVQTQQLLCLIMQAMLLSVLLPDVHHIGVLITLAAIQCSSRQNLLW